MIRVVIADDQGMVRAGLRSLLEGERDIEVVGEASDGAQVLALVRRSEPDVVLMDVRMPQRDGISATRELVAAGLPTRVLMLTTYDLDEYVFSALRAGAGGFLLKDASAEELVDAVRVIAAGEGLLARSATTRLIAEFARSPAADPAAAAALTRLTAREVDVLRLLARGSSNPEIAASLVVSAATVKTHVASILAKLNLRDRVQAAIFAYESGLVRPGES